MGALIPASEWLDFYLLSSLGKALARSCQRDSAARNVAWSRWARLAGIASRRSAWFPVGAFGWFWKLVRQSEHFELSFTLPGETELGNAEEQPNEG